MGLFGPPNVEQMKANRDVKGLVKALCYQKDYRVCAAAAGALDALDWRPGQDKIGAAYWAGKGNWDRCVEIGAPAIEPLVALLRDRNAYLRAAVIGTLTRIGTPGVKPLIAALKHRESGVRRAAAKVLGQIGDARAVEPLVAALKADQVPNEAAIALGQLGDARAVEPLIAALNSGSSVVEPEAARLLGRLGGARAVKALIAAFNYRHFHTQVVDALVEIGPPAVNPLIAALNNDDEDVCRWSAATLGYIGPRIEDDALRARAAESLVATCKDKKWAGGFDVCAVEPLIVKLKDANEGVRRWSATMLGYIGDDSVKEPAGGAP
jgi:HEAT repeat protein